MEKELVYFIIGTLLASTPGFYGIYLQRKKFDASAAKSSSDAMINYNKLLTEQTNQIGDLMRRIDTLECEVDELKKENKRKDMIISKWQAGISLLLHQLSAADITPVWKPEPEPHGD